MSFIPLFLDSPKKWGLQPGYAHTHITSISSYYKFENIGRCKRFKTLFKLNLSEHEISTAHKY